MSNNTKAMFDANLEHDFRQATSLRDAGDLTGARAVLERLARNYPNTFGVWLVLGGIQCDQHDYIAAERSLSMATALEPKSELASLALFHTLKHLDVNDAFAELSRFLALRPESYEYALLMSEMREGAD